MHKKNSVFSFRTLDPRLINIYFRYKNIDYVDITKLNIPEFVRQKKRGETTK